MRKLVSILLLCCLFINTIGYHIIFLFHQHRIKMEMKRLVLSQPQSDGGHDFIFSLNDKAALASLKWEGDDEFSLNGEMYDVISKKIENGKLVIRTLADKRETALVKKYSLLNKDDRSNTNKSLALKLADGLYLPGGEAIRFVLQNSTDLSSPLHVTMISPGIHDVLTPPPRHC